VNRWSRKKGRFVLEAAYLVPMVCLLMVYLVRFTLYAHDCAVCAHTMMEAGMKGIYREEKTSGEMEDLIRQDLQKKLKERLLWMGGTGAGGVPGSAFPEPDHSSGK